MYTKILKLNINVYQIFCKCWFFLLIAKRRFDKKNSKETELFKIVLLIKEKKKNIVRFSCLPCLQKFT